MTSKKPSAKSPIGLRIVRGFLAIAFFAAGALKLAGIPAMVAVFDQVGLGQWFRYVTGAIEVGGALMLLNARLAGVAGIVLSAAMCGAILSHLTVVAGSPLPAVLLLVLSLVVAWAYRGRTLSLLTGRPAHEVNA